MPEIDGNKIELVVEKVLELFEKHDVTPNEVAAITAIIDLNLATTLCKNGKE